ncbi:MAG: SPOR domain-containing protein [Sulfurovaceae bacterium]
MKDHNLDDLIIDDMETKSKSSIKSILTTIILIIIVLILAIFSTKILLQEPSKPPLINEQNYTQTANPDLQLETNGTDDVNNSSASIPASTDAKATPDSQTIDSKPSNIPEVINQKLQGTTAQPSKVLKTSENKEANKSTTIQNKANIEVKKDIPKPEVKNEIYYIQVGSFTSKPNETFLAVIKNSNYNYQVKTSKQGETTISKFLIGPYNSREKAEKELIQIKTRINKSAFIVKQ